jgi:hypothetical protein
MTKIIRTILPLLFLSLVMCGDDDFYTIAKGNILINQGNTDFIPKRKLHEIGHFSGISIQLPDSISGNLKSLKLSLKNGKEFNISADLINENDEIINCKMESIGISKVCLMKAGYLDSRNNYRKVIIHSEISFETQSIEWFSTDKF